MYKKYVIFSIILATIAGVIGSLYMMEKTEKEYSQVEEEKNEIKISEVILDDCTDEYEQILLENVEEANAEEEKVSPNAIITFKKYYKKCEHTVKRYEPASKDIVNLTQDELKDKYNGWEVQSFSPQEIILFKELDGECGEHFMLRNVNGYVAVYEIDTNGEEILKHQTDIPTEYLTETDLINIENGLIVYGKESLNQLLEDFE